MTKLVWTVLFVGVVACGVPAAPKIAFSHREVRGRLEKNGLKFVVMPDDTTSLVEVDVRYEVGSREDPPGKAGLAHLVEHLMFLQRPDGPETRPLSSVLQQVALGLNAYTNWDSTHYMVNARSEAVDALVKIEAMRMFYGCQTIPEQEFLREREVVRNEIRSRVRDGEDRVPELTLQGIYPKGHAYARSIGGDDEQLAALTLRDACEFMQRYYAPERATVVIAGGVNANDVVASIQRWFAVLERRAPAPRRAVEPVQVTAGRATVELDVQRPWVTVAWPLPDGRTPEGEAAALGIFRAFSGAAGLADEYECATNGYPTTLGGREAPVFMIALEVASVDKIDQCLDFVWKAARDASVGWDSGSWRALEELKNRRKAAVIAQLEPLFGNGGRTDHVADLVQFSRDVEFDSRDVYVFHELEKVSRFNPEVVGEALARALDRSRARVTVFTPSKQQGARPRRAAARFAGVTDPREAPEVDPAEAQHPLRVAAELKGLASATRFQLGNGMRVVLLPSSSMPVVAGQLIFDVGDATDPGRPAIAPLAARLLSHAMGTTALGETGIAMRCRTTADHTLCDARGMSIYTDVVIKGFERLIKVGEYRQLAVEREQKQVRDDFQLRRTRQRAEFVRQQLAAVYGPSHPYTRTGIVTPAAIDQLGRDALASFRDDHYTAANATLILAGSFDAKAAEATIRDTFGDWGAGRKDAPVERTPNPRTGPIYVGVAGDADPQVDVAILYPSPAGISGQEAARLVMTEMLNDHMSEIRTKLGATYGTFARRDARLAASAYVLGGSVDAARAGEAVRAMRAGVAALRDGSELAVEFARARRKIVQQLLGESTLSVEMASRLGRIARFGVDPGYYNTLLKQAAALSIAQVKDLIARELAPANEVIVALGERDAVAKAFAEAELTGIKFVEAAE